MNLPWKTEKLNGDWRGVFISSNAIRGEPFNRVCVCVCVCVYLEEIDGDVAEVHRELKQEASRELPRLEKHRDEQSYIATA